MQLQLIRQCTNITRLHWVASRESPSPAELGDTPFRNLHTLVLGYHLSLEGGFIARMIELTPVLAVLDARVTQFGKKSLKAICAKEELAWTSRVSGGGGGGVSGIQAAHLQEIDLEITEPELGASGWACLELLEELRLPIRFAAKPSKIDFDGDDDPAVEGAENGGEGTGFGGAVRSAFIRNLVALKNIRILRLPASV
ncbi:hypothetical protein BGX29_010335 [Mortierella sp. GBA35]|nr:hypothetical protein BGX29_010335 [Mortierella sp. GBA35]